jgi:hypothetical protein
MSNRTRAWLLFSVLSASLLVLVPGPLNFSNPTHAGTLQADGTHPPAPPIPWRAGAGDSLSAGVLAELPPRVLAADGTHPPAPPIPWRRVGDTKALEGATMVRRSTALTADGTQPPAPPIPWGQLNVAAEA